MSAPSPGTVLLFVGGDPSVGERLLTYPQPLGGVTRYLLGVLGAPLLPSGKRPPPPGTNAPEDPGLPWLVPVDQLRCIELLDEAAQHARRQVRVIDVNRPEENDRPLVTEWVGSEDVLPVLVRADGSRLVGEESFSPASLRQFLSVP